MPAKKIWIISGESSGDSYGAELAKAIRSLCPDAGISGMGGEKMRQAGVDIMVDAAELGIVGYIEVFKKLFFFIGLMRNLTARAMAERPDVVVMIDYPGFNIRLAQRLNRIGIKVIYYISPQVWAWKKNRIYTLERCVKRMLCIFPFEPKTYEKTSLKAEFVGHPLLELLRPYRERGVERDDKLLLLLPGSRGSELKFLVPDFVRTAQRLWEKDRALRFAMPLPREKSRILAEELMAGMGLPEDFKASISLSIGNTRELMTRACAGLAASGTVTVEAVMLGLPLVVAYRLNWLVWQYARRVVKLPSITIANLVTGRTVYQECLQGDAVADKMAPALESIMPGGGRRQECLDGIEECLEKLGKETLVSRNVARVVLEECR